MRKDIFRKVKTACTALCLAGAVLFSPFGATSVKASPSPLDGGVLWIGDTQVTGSNCGDIFGDGTAVYDPETLTLTLNGVRIGPDRCHIEDAGGNTQSAMDPYAENWGIYSLYAKNTVAHIVVNGVNTFETPVVIRSLDHSFDEQEGYTEEALIGLQYHIWDGIVIDSSGIPTESLSITGAGTLTSLAPVIQAEREWPNGDGGGFPGMQEGQGGIGLYWSAGASKQTLFIGICGGEIPVLDLSGGVAGLALNNITTDVYNTDPAQTEDGTDGSDPERSDLAQTEGGTDGGDPERSDLTQTEGGTDGGDPERPDLAQTGGGLVEDLDPTRESEIPAQEDTPAKPAYSDMAIDVQAYTDNRVIYSVDVEWGAMTFRYENNIWDTEHHKEIEGKGWQVYDSVSNRALDTREDAINRIQVTNYSNADIRAVLAYVGAAGYEETTGSFAAAQGDTGTSFDAAACALVLTSANNGEDGANGIPTVGVVYFMPSGIKEELKNSISKWTQIGTITVEIEVSEP